MPRLPGSSAAALKSSEYWPLITDPKLRRRIQNRINARLHRQRQRERLALLRSGQQEHEQQPRQQQHQHEEEDEQQLQQLPSPQESARFCQDSLGWRSEYTQPHSQCYLEQRQPKCSDTSPRSTSSTEGCDEASPSEVWSPGSPPSPSSVSSRSSSTTDSTAEFGAAMLGPDLRLAGCALDASDAMAMFGEVLLGGGSGQGLMMSMLMAPNPHDGMLAAWRAVGAWTAVEGTDGMWQ